MQTKYLIPVCVVIISCLLVQGCERDEFQWGTEVGNITYSGNVIFIGSEELGLLKEVTPEQMIFSGTTGEIDNITDGSILVIGVSEKTPYGLLRKVNGMQKDGNDIVILTSDAVLSKTVKEGTITFRRKLLEKDFTLKSKVEGVLVKGPDKYFDGLAVTLDDFEIYNDGTKRAVLNGAIGISPEINITINFSLNSIYAIQIATILNKIDEITLSSNGAFSGSREIVAAEFVHSPIIIDSLVFVPEVVITCGFDGSVSCEVVSGVRQDRVMTSNMNYLLSKWSEDPLKHSETIDFITPLVTDNSDIKIYSGPEIITRLFGIPLQTVKAAGFHSLKAQKAGSPLWQLFAGTEGYNTINAGILGLKDGYTTSMEIQASEVASANDK
ncbi:MAG: hypothetical protein ACOXZV_12615 [Bacteroidales bacterium]|jgi:hypothetical protein